MSAELIISALYSAITLLYGSVFTLLFLEVELNNRKNLISFVIFVIGNLGLQYGLGYFISVDMVVFFYPLIVHFPLFLFCTKYCGKSILTTVSSIMMCYILTSPRYILGEMIVALIPELPFRDSVGKMIASVLLVFPIYHWILPVMRKSFKRNAKDLMHYFLPLILIYTLSYVLYVYTDLLAKNSVLMMEIMFTLFFLISFYYQQKYFVSRDDMIEKEKRNQILELSTEALKRQLDIMNESNERTKILRHDMRHYATMVRQYAGIGDVDKVISISEEIEKKNNAAMIKSYCSNPWINLLLNTYVYQFEEMGIKPIMDISVPAEILIREMDLCVILGNILDNAIGSIGMCKEHPSCSILFRHDGGKLYLEVQNSCETSVSFQNGIPLSTRSGHGYGCKSIVYITEKYHGICSFELQENIFVTRVILHEQ